MTTIRIDRITVKTIYPEPPPLHMSGIIFGEIPLCIRSEIEVIAISRNISVHPIQYDFIVENPDNQIHVLHVAEVMRKPEMIVHMHREMIETTCKDSIGASLLDNHPYQTYSYENTPVCCTNCGHWVGYHDIKKETFINEDGDEFEHDVCEFCGESDPFKYKFEVL